MVVLLSGIFDCPPWSPLAGGAALISVAFAATAVLRPRHAPSLLRDCLLLLSLTVSPFGLQVLLAAATPEWLRKNPASRVIRLDAVARLAFGDGTLLTTAVRPWGGKSEAVRTARRIPELIVWPATRMEPS